MIRYLGKGPQESTFDKFTRAHCLAAGKEGVRWHIYPHIRYLYTNGALKCCKWDGCWLGGVKGHCKDLVEVHGEKVPRCFEMIKPRMILIIMFTMKVMVISRFCLTQ